MIAPRRIFVPLGSAARIGRVLGLDARSRLPAVNTEALLRYYRYLAENLCFPFEAQFYDDREGAACDHSVTATRLRPLAAGATPVTGRIECEIAVCGGTVVVPLSGLRPVRRTANHQLIDDYRKWLRGGF